MGDSFFVREALDCSERWRFLIEPVREVPARIRGLANRNSLLDPTTVRSTLEGEVQGALVIDESFPEIASEILEPEKWRLVWNSPFKYDEAIHVKEARSVLAAVRHVSRD
eukprot:4763811-Karenia_brevis.AAC.1